MQESSIKPEYYFQFGQFKAWYDHLMQHGYVVIKSVISQEEVQHTTNLFWQWLQSLGSGIQRNRTQTWANKAWPGADQLGFFVSYGGCHTKASWFLRCHPRVQQVFKSIWKTQHLITSFDTFISWKPWWGKPKQLKQNWQPYVQNLHLDQNPHYKKGLKCVQGMIPLRRVRETEVGGLMVVPDTNNNQTQGEIVNRYPGTTFSSSDWLQLKQSDPYMAKGKLLQCQAGDMILWDSRTIHGGLVKVPSQQFQEQNKNQLIRLSLTVTMVPKEWANAEVLKKRRQAFKKKIGLTHWPHEYHTNCMGKMAPLIEQKNIKYESSEPNQTMLNLIG